MKRVSICRKCGAENNPRYDYGNDVLRYGCFCGYKWEEAPNEKDIPPASQREPRGGEGS